MRDSLFGSCDLVARRLPLCCSHIAGHSSGRFVSGGARICVARRRCAPFVPWRRPTDCRHPDCTLCAGYQSLPPNTSLVYPRRILPGGGKCTKEVSARFLRPVWTSPRRASNRNRAGVLVFHLVHGSLRSNHPRAWRLADACPSRCALQGQRRSWVAHWLGLLGVVTSAMLAADRLRHRRPSSHREDVSRWNRSCLRNDDS